MGGVGAKARARLDRRKALLTLLRKIRKEAGLRQVEMAQRLGRPQSFVRNTSLANYGWTYSK